MRILELNQDTKKNILEDLLKRSPNNYDEYAAKVADILNAVKARGDEAVFEYTMMFDKAQLDTNSVKVTKEEITLSFKTFLKTDIKSSDVSFELILSFSHENFN